MISTSLQPGVRFALLQHGDHADAAAPGADVRPGGEGRHSHSASGGPALQMGILAHKAMDAPKKFSVRAIRRAAEVGAADVGAAVVGAPVA